MTRLNVLPAALARRGSPDAFLYAFDILELDGCDLRLAPPRAAKDRRGVHRRIDAGGLDAGGLGGTSCPVRNSPGTGVLARRLSARKRRGLTSRP